MSASDVVAQLAAQLDAAQAELRQARAELAEARAENERRWDAALNEQRRYDAERAAHARTQAEARALRAILDEHDESCNSARHSIGAALATLDKKGGGGGA